MGNRFASGKYSISQCDRCDGRYKLHELRIQVVKTKPYQLKVCRQCWDPDHPQLQLGMYPVDDPQGVRDPRPDRSYWSSGTTGLQIENNGSTNELAQGFQSEGSRDIQWGWDPVGGSRLNDDGLTPNNLVMQVEVGDVEIGMSRTVGLRSVTGYGQVSSMTGPPQPITGVSGTASVSNWRPITSGSYALAGSQLAFLTVSYDVNQYQVRMYDPRQSEIDFFYAVRDSQAAQLFIDITPTYPPGSPATFVNLGVLYGSALTVSDSTAYVKYPGLPIPTTGPYYVGSEVRVLRQFYLPYQYPFTYSTNGTTATWTYTGAYASQLYQEYLLCPTLPAGSNIWASYEVYDGYIWAAHISRLGTLLGINYDSATTTFTVTYTVVTPYSYANSRLVTDPVWFVPNTYNG